MTKFYLITATISLFVAITYAHSSDSGCNHNVYNYYGGGDEGAVSEPNLIEGPVGKPGKMGATGETGPTGPQGPKGESGADGNCQCHCDLSELEATFGQQLAQIQSQLKMLQCGQMHNGFVLNDVCYFIILGELIGSAPEAEAKCQARGGSTSVRVKTREVYQNIIKFLQKADGGNTIQIWLGGTYKHNGNEVYWSDGTTTTPDYWYPGYPQSNRKQTAMFIEWNRSGNAGIFNYLSPRSTSNQYPFCQISL